MSVVAVAVLAGVLIGISLGALGGGGSILTVPALVYLVGQDATTATTGSLVIVGVTSLVALLPHARAGRVRFGQGLVFGALGVGGSYLGSSLAAGVDPDLLLRAFAGLMLVVAVVMIRRSLRPSAPGDPADALEPSMISWRPLDCRCGRVGLLVLVASAVGLLTGFFGVGGGFVLVPALVLALRFTMPVAVGTSLLVIAVNSATALIARIGHGISLDWGVIALFTAAAIVGSLVGGRLVSRVPAAHLSRAFAGLLVLVALGIGLESLLRG